MTESQILALAATMFALLIAIIGWIGVRTIHAIDQMRDRLDAITNELCARISSLDCRVTVIEAKHGGKYPQNPD